MLTIGEALIQMRLCAKPILFEVGVEDAPYGGLAGTGCMVRFKQDLFLITARHIVKENHLDALLVFPNDETNESIPFKSCWVPHVNYEDSDCSDFILVRVELEKLIVAERSVMKVLDLERASDDWRSAPHEQRFLIFGYPTEACKIEYHENRIMTTQHLMFGNFVGCSPSGFCYELEVVDFNGVTDLNGFSGSPVLSVPRVFGNHIHPSFCGMAIRGTKESGRIHFLDIAVLRKAIEYAVNA